MDSFFSDMHSVLLYNANSVLDVLSAYAPKILKALIILIVGVIIAYYLKKGVIKLLDLIGFSEVAHSDFIGKFFSLIRIKRNPVIVISDLIYWLVVLLFVSSAINILDLVEIGSIIAGITAYVPAVFIAVTTIVVALIVARFLSKILTSSLERINFPYSSLLGKSVELVLVLFGLGIAITHLGIDISLITTNVTIFIAGFVALVVFALANSSRSGLSNMVSGYHVRKIFKVGDEVSILGFKGKVIQITDMMLILETETGNKYLPNDRVLKYGSTETHSS